MSLLRWIFFVALMGSAVAAPSASALSLAGVYALDGSLEPRYGSLPALLAAGPGSFGTDGYRVTGDGGLTLDATRLASPADYTLVLDYDVDYAGAKVRLLEWEGGAGLYNGWPELVVEPEGVSGLAPYRGLDDPHRVIVRREGATGTVTVNDGPAIDDAEGRFLLDSSLRLFGSDADGHGGGRVSGLWVFSGSDGLPYERLSIKDETIGPPRFWVPWDDPGFVTTRPEFLVELDEAQAVRFSVWTSEGVEVAQYEAAEEAHTRWWSPYWAAVWPESAPDLMYGVPYVLAVHAVDWNGNVREDVVPIVADNIPPSGLNLAATPALTIEPYLVANGSVVVGPGDNEYVEISFYRGPAAVDGALMELWGGQFVGPDGGFVLRKMGAVAPGVYTIEVTHSDRVWNTQRVTKTVEVLDPDEERPLAVPQPAPIELGPPPLDPPFDPEAASRRAARSFARALMKRLVARGLRPLRRGIRVPFRAPSGGIALYSVRSGGELVAQGRRRFHGARSRTIVVRSRRAHRYGARGVTVKAGFAADGGRAVVVRGRHVGPLG